MGETSKLGCCGNFTRVLLFIINLFFAILGVVILALGVFLLIQGRQAGASTRNSFAGPAGLFITTGAIIVFTSVMGNIAIIFRWRPILVLYALVLSLAIILQVISAVLLFVFRNDVLMVAEGVFLDDISRYRVFTNDTDFNRQVNTRVSTAQENLRCCGFNNASDWISLNPSAIEDNQGIPPACAECGPNTLNCTTFTNATLNISFNTTAIGCSSPSKSTRAFAIAVISFAVVAIVFGLLQVIGIMMACGLCCCITHSRSKNTAYTY